MKRFNNRPYDQVRPITITKNIFEFAAASVQLEVGRTKVLCAISLVNKVPPFLKGKKTGWLTAEYAMLPAATHTRTDRELNSCNRNGRNVEISRLIGRCLRAVVDLSVLGERTIMVDCDILQADGSTRTACITAASLALKYAQQAWMVERVITTPFIKHDIAAVSVGLVHDTMLIDLDFEEDSMIEADFNIVMTRDGRLVEIQGCAEKTPLHKHHYDMMIERGSHAIHTIFTHIYPAPSEKKVKAPFNPIRISSPTELV